MGVLKMLAQNDMERELYEGRLKARRDLQTMETERRMALEKAEEYSRRFEEADRRAEEADRRAMGSIEILRGARVVDDLTEGIADCPLVIGCSAVLYLKA